MGLSLQGGKLTLPDIEGVLVAKKDFNLPKHPEIDTKNLYVRNPHATQVEYRQSIADTCCANYRLLRRVNPLTPVVLSKLDSLGNTIITP